MPISVWPPKCSQRCVLARGVELELLRFGEMRPFIGRALEFLFGCRHGAMSRVFTIHGRTYQVCCDCGAEREYSFETMSARHGFMSHHRPASSLGARHRDRDVAIRMIYKPNS